MKSVTIQDIAREADVGKSTVSRVINGKGYVSEETVRRVKRVMDKYQYLPSAVARSLSRQNSETIGLVLPEVNNPFFGDILQGVSAMVDRFNYTLILSGTDNDPSKDMRSLRAMCCQRVKGLIYIPATDYAEDPLFSEIERLLAQLDCPVVLLDRPIQRLPYDCVTTDNFSGAYTATEALIKAGHRRIGVVAGDMELFIGRERYEGFCKAIEANGLTLDANDVIFGQFNADITYNKVLAMLNAGDYPRAFFVSNNLSERGFLRALNEKGIVIPDDIAFVGFDHMIGQDVFNMPYTCLDREVRALGEHAARLLFRRFDSPDRPPENVVVVPRIVLRGSERLVLR